MAHRPTPLDPDAVDDIPGRCRSCVFWELGGERPDEHDLDRCARDRVRKQAWATSVAMESGPPGVIVRDGHRAVGWAGFAPAERYGPRGPGVPRPSPDALLLATVWLLPEARSTGMGRQIVVASVREAVRLGLEAVEAYGDRRARELDCVLPAAWLVHEGFEIAAEHPRYPLHRIEVKRTLPWAESLEHAMDALLRRAPAPAAPVPTGPQVPATSGDG